MKKRLLSLLLCLVAVLTLLPLPALADGGHSHCICGGDVTAGDHTGHTDVTYQPWNGTSGITYANGAAYVYLTGNATLSGQSDGGWQNTISVPERQDPCQQRHSQDSGQKRRPACPL